MGSRGRKSAAELSIVRPGSRITARPIAAQPARKLGPAGQAVWDRLTAAYDFADPAGAEILLQCCQAVDLAEETNDSKLELQCRAFVARTLSRLCES